MGTNPTFVGASAEDAEEDPHCQMLMPAALVVVRG